MIENETTTPPQPSNPEPSSTSTNPLPSIHTSSIDTYTPTQIQSRLLLISDAGIPKLRPIIQFSTLQQLQSFKELLADHEEDLTDDSESEDEEEYKRTHQETIDIDEKKAIILQRHYSSELQEISKRFSTKLIFTADKIKLFTDSDDRIDLCLRHLSMLSQKIEVMRITKSGNTLFQSKIYEQILKPIRILKWQTNYYFYFSRDQIQSEKAHRIIKQTQQLQHWACYLLPKPKSTKMYETLILSIHGKYALEKILKAQNQSEKQEFRSEISKDGRSIIYHSKNMNYLNDRHEIVNQSLLKKTFSFLLTFKPTISKSNIQAIRKSINPFNKYVEKDFYTDQYVGAVGIIINKNHLKLILQETKENFRDKFGKIFEKVYQINGDQVDMIIYMGGASEAKKKYIKATMQPNFRLEGLETDILVCQPKQFGANFSQTYLTPIHKIIQFNEPSLNSPNVSRTNVNPNNTTSFNQTSVIHSQSFMNQKTLQSQSQSQILNNISQTQIYDAKQEKKQSTYKFNLNLLPQYGPLQRPNADFQTGKKARAVNKQIAKVTGQDCDTVEIVLNQKFKGEQGQGRPTVTLLMNENVLFRETEYCYLYKIKLGSLANGYLVQVDITNLEEHGNYFKGTNAAVYRPTHKCVVL